MEIGSKDTGRLLFCFALSIFVSFAMIFVLFRGLYVLNPSSTDWMANGDLASYHLCSIYFAADEWRFPLGLNPNYGEGFDASIAQCSPSFLFSIADKVLVSLGVLGHGQQHHGYIILINLTLQFFVGYLIFRHLLGKGATTVALLCALLLTQMPQMLVRNTAHIDLGTHYIILLGIFAIVAGQARLHLWFFLIALLSVFTHVYMFGMVFGLYCLGIALNIQRQLPLMNGSERSTFLLLTLVKVVATIIASIVIFYALTGMSTETSLKDDIGYGYYRADLLTFFDGNGSIFLGDLPSDGGEYEGSFYIGVGFLTILVGVILANFWGEKANLKVCDVNWKIIALFCLLCTLYATSNRLSVGPAELVIPIKAWEDFGAVFRAGGRFIWLPGYILCIAAAYFLAKSMPRRPLLALLIVANALQFTEMVNYFRPQPREWSERYAAPMTALKQSGMRGIRTLEPGFVPPPGEAFVELAYPAAISGLSIDQFYLARSSTERAAEIRRERFEALFRSHFEPGFAYLVPVKSVPFLQTVPLGPEVFTYLMGDYIVITISEVTGLDPVDIEAFLPLEPAAPLSGMILSAFLGDGWGDVEPSGGAWSLQEEADITIPRSYFETGKVTLRLISIGAMASPEVPQGLRVICPDDTLALTEGDGLYLCRLSAEGKRAISIHVDVLYTPQQLGINEDLRRLGVYLQSIELQGM